MTQFQRHRQRFNTIPLTTQTRTHHRLIERDDAAIEYIRRVCPVPSGCKHQTHIRYHTYKQLYTAYLTLQLVLFWMGVL